MLARKAFLAVESNPCWCPALAATHSQRLYGERPSSFSASSASSRPRNRAWFKRKTLAIAALADAMRHRPAPLTDRTTNTPHALI